MLPPIAIYTMPYPPSANRLWRTFKGRLILSKIGRTYYAKAVKELLPQIEGKILDPVAVHVRAWRPDKRRRDVHNLTKIVYDALTKAGAWEDDTLAEDSRVSWNGSYMETRKGTPIHVLIYPLDKSCDAT